MREKRITVRVRGGYVKEADELVTLPRPAWEGNVRGPAGISLKALYLRRDGTVFAKTDSIWADIKHPGRCVGIRYCFLNDQERERAEELTGVKLPKSSS